MDVAKRGNVLGELQHRAQLVRTQRLRRRDVERARGRVLRQAGQDGQTIAQGLSGTRAGGDHHVAPLPRRLCHGDLVGIELSDALFLQRRPQLRQDPLGPLGIARGLGGQGGGVR